VRCEENTWLAVETKRSSSLQKKPEEKEVSWRRS
jgi:hypothetical protein